MKIWNSGASEHSMNLVMIGRFKQVQDAEEARRLIDRLSEQVAAEAGVYQHDSAALEQRFSEDMLQLLTESRLHTLGPSELGQFESEFDLKVVENQVVITTDEVEVSAFLKVLLDKGAHVEVYSAHEYPDKESDK